MLFHFKNPPKFKGKYSFNITLVIVFFLVFLTLAVFFLIAFFSSQIASIIAAV